VKVFWLNKELLKERLKSIAEEIGSKFRNIKRIILFGSQSEDRATPFSDIDILIIVDKEEKSFLKRSDPYIEYFQNLKLDTDIFVYTEEEFKRSPFANVTEKQKCRILFTKIGRDTYFS